MTEYHRCFRDNAGIIHFVVKVITFTSTLTNTGKYRNTAMLLCNVMNKLLHQNCFTYTRTAEQTDFTALGIRSHQVNNFNSCFQNFCLCR